MAKRFVELTIADKTYKRKVPIDNCEDVDDFRESIKATFAPLLNAYCSAQLNILCKPRQTTGPDQTISLEPTELISSWEGHDISVEVQGGPEVTNVVNASIEQMNMICQSKGAEYQLKRSCASEIARRINHNICLRILRGLGQPPLPILGEETKKLMRQ